MIDVVCQDNGKGGTVAANNREYGGLIKNGVIIEENPGAISNPQSANTSIELPSETSTFHSHPSGNIRVTPDYNSSASSISSFGGIIMTYSFIQFPSSVDILNAGSNIHYVFGRGDNNVYIYNSSGIQSVISMKYFVTPQNNKK